MTGCPVRVQQIERCLGIQTRSGDSVTFHGGWSKASCSEASGAFPFVPIPRGE
jgi:hypothetical protein